MSLTLIAIIRAKPGRADSLQQHLHGMLAPSRAEAGCLQYDLHRDIKDADLIYMIEQWRDEEALAEHEASLAGAGHPLLPPPSLTPTVLRAGDTSNTIPGELSVLVDRRLLPGEELAADKAALERRLAAPGIRFEVIVPENHWSASEVPADGGFADLVREAATAAGCRRAGEDLGTPYATDVGSLINDGGVEAVVFGAGDVAFAHRPEERVDLDEVRLAAAAVEGVVERLLLA